MTELPVDRPPDPLAVAGPAEFVERLRELRVWAGSPSYRRLRRLAGTTVDTAGTEIPALPVSTASYVLRGDRLPRMEFVRAFVTACLRARRRDPDTIGAETERWHEAWRRLRQGAGTIRPARVPRQLPMDAAGFTGRADELALLDKALAQGGGGGWARDALDESHPVSTFVVTGIGGVGKSALAIHAAHRLADKFPDGQLYVDLHGATAGLAPLAALPVLGSFLRALGVSAADIPDQLDDAAARLRTELAGRRVLMLLDNATDEAQIRPLLPGSPTCRVLVTARPALPGLDGAGHLQLTGLPEPDAVAMLRRVVDAERVAAEPDAAADLARWCGCLPLALRLAGARLAARPTWPVAALAERLGDERRRLDELRVADAGVRASFDVSHQQLRDSDDPADRTAAAAFGLLGVWDGPDLPLPVAARLLDLPDREAERPLERLADARLLESRTPGRYQLHDLLRLYAREQAAQTYSAAERIAAVARALRFYTATAWRTMALLRPGDQRQTRADDRWTEGGREVADAAEAVTWLEAERPNLLAAAGQAAGIDQLADAAPQLAQALFGFFYTRRDGHDWEQVNDCAIRAARRLDDQAAEARAYSDLGICHAIRGRYDEAVKLYRHAMIICEHTGDRAGLAAGLGNLGAAYTQLERYDEASTCLRKGLEIRRSLGDRGGEATIRYNLGRLCWRSGRLDEALGHLGESLAAYRELGDLHGQAMNLNGLASVYHLQARHSEALDCLRQSLQLNQTLGSRYNQAADLDTIGTIHHAQGRYAEALDCYRQSLAIARDLGTRRDETEVLRNLGVTLQVLGRTVDARAHWTEALAICEELQLPADELRALLAGEPPARESRT